MKELMSDFRKFIMRGNVLDLAVAVIIGLAFNAVVNSLVNDVIMQIIAAIFGKPNFDDLEPLAAQAVAHILERAQAHGIKAGIHNGLPESALARVAMGFRFVTIGSDARFLAAGSQQVLGRMRAGSSSD